MPADPKTAALEKAQEIWPCNGVTCDNGMTAWDLDSRDLRKQIAAAILEAQADALEWITEQKCYPPAQLTIGVIAHPRIDALRKSAEEVRGE